MEKNAGDIQRQRQQMSFFSPQTKDIQIHNPINVEISTFLF